MTEREAFEKWYLAHIDDKLPPFEPQHDYYLDATVDDIWQAWKARAARPADSDWHSAKAKGTAVANPTAAHLQEQSMITCGRCRLPLHQSEAGVRSFGTYQAHAESRRIELLHARIAELEIACATGWGEPQLIKQLKAERDTYQDAMHQMRVAGDALRADAERYRFLRNYPRRQDLPDGKPWWNVSEAYSGEGYVYTGPSLDAAIDAAMASAAPAQPSSPQS